MRARTIPRRLRKIEALPLLGVRWPSEAVEMRGNGRALGRFGSLGEFVNGSEALGAEAINGFVSLAFSTVRARFIAVRHRVFQMFQTYRTLRTSRVFKALGAEAIGGCVY